MTEILQSSDLILRLSNLDFAKNVAMYYSRNKHFLEEYEPSRNEEFFTEGYQFNSLKWEIMQAVKKQAFRFYISTKITPEKIIGIIALNNIVWGCFDSCSLGYKLDAQLLNKGYMTQAVMAVTKMAFKKLKLHRIEANVMPHNKSSLRVLEKCGYENEGLSKKYLKINGVWEDHIHMVKINEDV